MRNYLSILALISLLICSCSKTEQPLETGEDTPEEILMAVQHSYSVYELTDNGQQYEFEFYENPPITLKRDYPEGIPRVSIDKTEVSELLDDGWHIKVFFVSGNEAELVYGCFLHVVRWE